MPVTGWKKPFTSPPAPSWPGWANAAAGAKMKKIANVVTAARFMSKLHRPKSFDDASYLGAFTYLTSQGDAWPSGTEQKPAPSQSIITDHRKSTYWPEVQCGCVECPLWVKSRHLHAKRHVRFPPIADINNHPTTSELIPFSKMRLGARVAVRP